METKALRTLTTLAAALALACGLILAAAPAAQAEELAVEETISFEGSFTFDATYANYGADYLTGFDLELYEDLKAFVEDVAANGGSTVFTKTYTLAEGEELDLSNSATIVRCLMVDCPYDLYWYDKTSTTGYTLSSSSSGSYTSYTLKVYLPVSTDYAGSEDYTVDAELAQATSGIVDTAQAIVEEYADETSVQAVLEGYRDEILALASYNYEAASGSVSYGDPWQLIWVFDGDEDTTVVCEGYSKAFQFLCDLTWPDNIPVTCYTVTGYLGSEGHMWNIVRVNAKSYLVDLTNSDEGAIGEDGELFLATAPASGGSAATGYTLAGYTYTYDSDMLALYGEDILTLASTEFPDVRVVEAPEAETGLVYTASEQTGVAESAEGYYTVTGGTATDAGTYTATLSLTGEDYVWASTGTSDDIEIEWSIEAATLSGASFTAPETAFSYDGTAHTLELTITLNGVVLVEGTDYTLAYSDNVNVGTATVIITAQGNYQGTYRATFTIAAATVSMPDYTLSFAYDGTEHTCVAADDSGLYTVTGGTATDAGTYTATLSLTDSNYVWASTGTSDDITLTWTITAVSLTGASFSAPVATFTYDGTEQTLELTVTLDGTVLVEGTDYTLTYSDNVDVGTASALVTGIGNYTGSVRVTYAIVEASLSGAEIALEATSYEYDGTAKTPAATVTVNGTVLVEGTDYTIAYANNVEVGTATVTITGMGNYTGSEQTTFSIVAEAEEEEEPSTGDDVTDDPSTNGDSDDDDANDDDVTITYDYFTDVQSDSVGTSVYEGVYSLAAYGYVTGTSATTYSPSATTTRAQMVTILWRIMEPEAYAAYDASSAVGGTFTDVVDGKYYTAAVEWAVEQGITKGTSATAFSPNATCTFEQFCTFVARAINGGDDATSAAVSDAQAASLLARFSDGADTGASYDNSVAFLVQAGIVSGNTDGTLVPGEQLSRGRMAALMWKVIQAGYLA